MEVLREKYPRATEWIRSLDPFIVIRGDKHVIIKFSDDRVPLELSYEAIADIEEGAAGDNPASVFQSI